jgi:hypothetical protein
MDHGLGEHGNNLVKTVMSSPSGTVKKLFEKNLYPPVDALCRLVLMKDEGCSGANDD